MSQQLYCVPVYLAAGGMLVYGPYEADEAGQVRDLFNTRDEVDNAYLIRLLQLPTENDPPSATQGTLPT